MRYWSSMLELEGLKVVLWLVATYLGVHDTCLIPHMYLYLPTAIEHHMLLNSYAYRYLLLLFYLPHMYVVVLPICFCKLQIVPYISIYCMSNLV